MSPTLIWYQGFHPDYQDLPPVEDVTWLARFVADDSRPFLNEHRLFVVESLQRWSAWRAEQTNRRDVWHAGSGAIREAEEGPSAYANVPEVFDTWPLPKNRDLSIDECVAILVAIHDITRHEHERIGAIESRSYRWLCRQVVKLRHSDLPDLQRLLKRAKSEVDKLGTAESGCNPAPSDSPAEHGAPTTPNATFRLLSVFTNGVADDRIAAAAVVLNNDTLTVNEKLTKIDALIRIPGKASAEQLGEMFGKTKQAVLKSEWWKQNRQGEKENEIGQRRDSLKKRGKDYEVPATDREAN